RLVEELAVHDPTLQRTQRRDAGQEQDRKGGEEMYPVGRLIRHLQPQGEDDGRQAAEGDDEEGGAVRRVGEGIVQPARLATVGKLQESLEQMPLSAPGAAPPETGPDRRQRRPV